MEWLNYHHLLYFWTVVRAGGVVAAANELRLSPPTVSGQLRALESALGEKLLVRVGRGVQPTDTGRLVYRYADEIFGLGRELVDTLKGRPTGRPARLQVGVVDALPKVVTRRLLEPALQMPEQVQLVVREDKSETLLAELALFRLDVVLSDAPILPHVKVKAYAHLLGETSLVWFASPALARRLRKGFPASFDGAPVLLPTDNTAVRRQIDAWFDRLGVRPRIVAEIEDSALLMVFGASGLGLFCAPDAVEDDVRRQYDVDVVGKTQELVERFYVISAERRLSNPAVVAISRQAKGGIFAAGRDAAAGLATRGSARE
jgi:LysR family transcriptional activator of nhaA